MCKLQIYLRTSIVHELCCKFQNTWMKHREVQLNVSSLCGEDRSHNLGKKRERIDFLDSSSVQNSKRRKIGNESRYLRKTCAD